MAIPIKLFYEYSSIRASLIKSIITLKSEPGDFIFPPYQNFSFNKLWDISW